MAAETLHIEGTVENILFKNDANGYVVLDLDAGGELITAVGNLGEVDEGEILILEGNYVTHKKFGTQFQVVYCERKLPETVVNIEKYLASGAIKGIGPGLARKIVNTFGAATLDIIEHAPHRLAEVKGISRAKCQDIAEEAKKLFALRSLMSFLSEYEIRSGIAMRTYQKFGADALEQLKVNPYILCDEFIDLDFHKADVIAKDMDIARDANTRIIAGMQYILKANSANGHSCLPLEILLKLTSPTLNISEQEFYRAYNYALEEDELFEYFRNNREYVYLPDYYRAETFIADRINVLRQFTSPEDFNYDALIDIEEEENHIKYEAIQRQAITTAVSRGLIVLTGGPGTGKTTTLNAIISIFEKKGEKVLLAAPTGRAAKRMSELTGYEAKTIHRLLEVVYDSGGRTVFAHNENNPLDCDVLVIDEMSMVDVILFEKLLRAVRLGCKLIMTGDRDQLPSVGAGNLLFDIIAGHCVPVVQLKEIFRQAKQSLIVTNAHAIIKGEMPELDIKNNDFFFFERSDTHKVIDLIWQLNRDRLPKAYNFSPTDDIQVITPSRKGVTGCIELNKVLQQMLNPPAKNKPEIKSFTYTFRLGDKVMQTKNNYDITWSKDGEQGAGVFNGDIGRIIEINFAAQTAVINFDGRIAKYALDTISQIELAYAITVHKSQGCEFEAVIMPVVNGFEKLCYRNLLYTAVTRAKKLIILIGSREQVRKMAEKNTHRRRYTCLWHMMRSFVEQEQDEQPDISRTDT